MLPILVRGDEHAQIVRRRALRLLRVAEQPRNRLHQRVVRLPHQQLFAVHPQIRRLQAQMIFDCGKVQLLRRGLLGNFERFLAREGALVRQHVHQRSALARPLQRNQQRLQKGVAVIRRLSAEAATARRPPDPPRPACPPERTASSPDRSGSDTRRSTGRCRDRRPAFCPSGRNTAL